MENSLPKCPRCGAAHPWKNGHSAAGVQVWLCLDCGRTWRETKARTGPKPRPNAREVAQEKFEKFCQRIRQADGDRLSISALRARAAYHLDRVEKGEILEITIRGKVEVILQQWHEGIEGAVTVDEFLNYPGTLLMSRLTPLITLRNGTSAIAFVPIARSGKIIPPEDG